MTAVLVQALGDYWDSAGVDTIAGRNRVRELRRWFERRDQREWPFSFENICDALLLDADAVRRVALGQMAGAADRRTRKRLATHRRRRVRAS
jgi:hypothetical protein